MLYIIGLAHRAQSYLEGREKDERQLAFEEILRRVVEEVQPTLIAEEDSEESLGERRASSIAKAIADERRIEHRFCDPLGSSVGKSATGMVSHWR